MIESKMSTYINEEHNRIQYFRKSLFQGSQRKQKNRRKIKHLAFFLVSRWAQLCFYLSTYGDKKKKIGEARETRIWTYQMKLQIVTKEEMVNGNAQYWIQWGIFVSALCAYWKDEEWWWWWGTLLSPAWR